MPRDSPIQKVDTELEVDNVNYSVVNNLDMKVYTQALQYSSGNPIYIGEAAAGTATSSATWRIKKITWSGDDATDIQWADGVDTFTKEWDERAGYSYS